MKMQHEDNSRQLKTTQDNSRQLKTTTSAKIILINNGDKQASYLINTTISTRAYSDQQIVSYDER